MFNSYALRRPYILESLFVHVIVELRNSCSFLSRPIK
jgi:hypothetical protein